MSVVLMPTILILLTHPVKPEFPIYFVLINIYFKL